MDHPDAYPLMPLESVLITDALERRSPRRPDLACENHALTALADVLAHAPDRLLQSLVETVVNCCRAESAGISLIERDEHRSRGSRGWRFHWQAIAGAFAINRGSGLGWEFAPCGLVVERDQTMLFDRPGRHFRKLADAEPEIVEGLLVPFHVDGRPAGTLWALSHAPDRRFDAEDARMLRSLSRFASAGHQLAGALSAVKLDRDELERRVHERTTQLEEAHDAQRRLSARLRGLATELSAAEHRERKRIAAVLHDSVQQLLVAARMQIRRAQNAFGETREGEAEAAKLIDQALEASRDLTDKLRPPILYEGGLISALQWLADEMWGQHQLRVTLSVDCDDLSLEENANVLLFESTRELLFNAAKYAGVDEVSLALWADAARVRIAVADRGAGFDPCEIEHSDGGGGFGLFSVQERVRALGGEMGIDAAPGEGARVTLDVPLEVL